MPHTQKNTTPNDTHPQDALELLDAPIWVFDLDNTLYHHSCHLFAEIDVHMSAFIQELLDLPLDEAITYQKQLFKKYGTTAKGLLEEGHIADASGFLKKVHSIDYSLVPPDPRLDEALSNIKGTKYILTNGTHSHAMSCLKRLGIKHHFQMDELADNGKPKTRVFDTVDANLTPKPQREPYDLFLQKFNLSRDAIRGAVFADDITQNLEIPHQFNMKTIWVNTENHDISGTAVLGEHVHYQTRNLSQFLHEMIQISQQGR